MSRDGNRIQRDPGLLRQDAPKDVQALFALAWTGANASQALDLLDVGVTSPDGGPELFDGDVLAEADERLACARVSHP